MANDRNEADKVYNHYLELSKPTEEDFVRVFTDEELKELCLKHACRVDMWRWNVVNDYRILFTDSGRYKRWSDRKRLLMLAKAVNKMKPSVLYDEEEIRKTRKEEWGIQLKENILSLNYWKRKKLRNYQAEHEPGPLLHVSDVDEIDEEIESQCAVNTESMNVNEIYTQSQQQTQTALGVDHVDDEIQSQCAVNTESMNFNEIYTESQQQTQPTLKVDHVQTQTTTTTAKAPTPALSTQSDEGNVLLDNWDEDYLFDEDSDDSTETVLLQQQHQGSIVATQPVETLQSEEVAPEIADIYGVNTLSMTIDSQFSTQTENIIVLQSQDVIPRDYDNFKNIIPLTSTQSQSQASEEIEVT